MNCLGTSGLDEGHTVSSLVCFFFISQIPWTECWRYLQPELLTGMEGREKEKEKEKERKACPLRPKNPSKNNGKEEAQQGYNRETHNRWQVIRSSCSTSSNSWKLQTGLLTAVAALGPGWVWLQQSFPFAGTVGPTGLVSPYYPPRSSGFWPSVWQQKIQASLDPPSSGRRWARPMVSWTISYERRWSL